MTALRVVLFVALRQLVARRSLHAIAIGGVALGVLTLIAMNGIMKGFQVEFLDQILRVAPHVTLSAAPLNEAPQPAVAAQTEPAAVRVLRAPPSEPADRIDAPFDLVRQLEALPDVQAACAGVVGEGLLRRAGTDVGVLARGVDPAAQDRCTPLSTYVTDGAWQTLSLRTDGAALGAGLADELEVGVGDRVTLVAGSGRSEAVTVVAIVATEITSIDDTHVYLDLPAAQRLLGRVDSIDRIELRLRDADAAPRVARQLGRLTGCDTESWQEASAEWLSLFALQNRIIGFVIVAILLVGGFGILAIQIMLVLEKTRDIAILRAVGLRRGDILWTFLVQGVIVSLVGAGLGTLAGWRLLEFLATLRSSAGGIVESETFLIHRDPAIYGVAVAFALIIGVGASVLPAVRGARVEPIDVLRGRIG